MFASFVALAMMAGPETVPFTVDGAERSAIVYRPTVTTKRKVPVYFVFHGLGGNAQLAAKQFHIQSLDPKALVLYGQGIPASNAATDTARRGANTWQIMPRQYADRDIHMIVQMIKWADENGGDPTRRYFVGHSNGSAFGWVVFKEIGASFTRFVGMNAGSFLPLDGAPMRPAFLTKGTDDRIVPASTVKAFAEKLAMHNGCGAPTESTILTYPGANPVYLRTYNGGHMPPADVYEQAVKFCQSGKI